MIRQAANWPLVIGLKKDITGWQEIHVDLKCEHVDLKHWKNAGTTQDITVVPPSDTCPLWVLICPIKQAESASWPAKRATAWVKYLDANGVTRPLDKMPISVGRFDDKHIMGDDQLITEFDYVYTGDLDECEGIMTPDSIRSAIVIKAGYCSQEIATSVINNWMTVHKDEIRGEPYTHSEEFSTLAAQVHSDATSAATSESNAKYYSTNAQQAKAYAQGYANAANTDAKAAAAAKNAAEAAKAGAQAEADRLIGITDNLKDEVDDHETRIDALESGGAGKTYTAGTGIAIDGNNVISSTDYLITEPATNSLHTKWATASGTRSVAIGHNSSATANDSEAIGFMAKSSGMNSAAIGSSSEASGVNSFAIGSGAVASGTASASLGVFTAATGNNQTVVGYANAEDANAKFIIGDGTGPSARHNALVIDKQHNAKFGGDVYSKSGNNYLKLASEAYVQGAIDDRLKDAAVTTVDPESLEEIIDLMDGDYRIQSFTHSFGTVEMKLAGIVNIYSEYVGFGDGTVWITDYTSGYVYEINNGNFVSCKVVPGIEKKFEMALYYDADEDPETDDVVTYDEYSEKIAEVESNIASNSSGIAAEKSAREAAVASLSEDLTAKMTEPSGAAVGQYFRVASIDADGHYLLEACDLPTASDSELGVVKTAVGYGLQPITSGANKGLLRASSRTLAQYIIDSYPLILGKGTLENIKTDLVGRALADTSATAYTAEQQAAARARLGLDKEWVLKGTLTTENKSTGVTVDLTGCTELYIIAKATATGAVNLLCNVQNLINGFLANGYRVSVSKFVDTFYGVENQISKYSDSDTRQYSISSGCSWLGDYSIAQITNIYFNNTSAVTSCNIKIYAR